MLAADADDVSCQCAIFEALSYLALSPAACCAASERAIWSRFKRTALCRSLAAISDGRPLAMPRPQRSSPRWKSRLCSLWASGPSLRSRILRVNVSSETLASSSPRAKLTQRSGLRSSLACRGGEWPQRRCEKRSGFYLRVRGSHECLASPTAATRPASVCSSGQASGSKTAGTRCSVENHASSTSMSYHAVTANPGRSNGLLTQPLNAATVRRPTCAVAGRSSAEPG